MHGKIYRMNRLPEKLLKLRKHYRFSQEYLSEVLNKEVTEYMAIENGRELPDYEELLKLSSLYRIDVEELFINSKEVTLYEVDDTTTDQINIEFFMKQNRWYRRLFRKIEKSRKLQVTLILCVLICLLLLGLEIRNLKKPLVFEVSDSERLSVSDNSVAYLLEDGKLVVTGQYSDVTEEDVVKAVATENFIVALKNDGTVKLFGSTTEDMEQVAELKNIEDITAADDHIIAIDKFDRIHVIGDNQQGELTLENMEKASQFKTFKNGTISIGEDGYLLYAGEVIGRSQFKSYRDPLDYEANENMTVVLKSDGTIDYSAYNDHYAPVTGWKDITDIACGDEFIAGLQSDGTVLISSLDEEMIEEVKNWKNIIAIDAGSDYLIGFDGKEIFGAGENRYGQFVKEGSEKTRVNSIDPETLTVNFNEEYITVEFEEVENAYAYRVSFNAGTTVSYEIRANEKALFTVEGLNEGVYYTISIVSLGKEGYEDSLPFEYSFEYTKPETKKESEDKTTEGGVIEVAFPVYQLVGKTREEFESYLKQYGVTDEKLTAIEDETPCDEEEEIILSVKGYEDGESITRSELLERDIEYRYCRLKKDGE